MYIASSKPYQRSAKKMWPLISPAIGAPVSFSLALTSEWPVLYISGTPPCARTSGARRWLHLTSKMIGAPLWRERMSRANSITCRSG